MRALVRSLALLMVLTAPCALAETSSAGENKESWTVNLDKVDIGVFIAQVADITGTTIVVNPKVKGQVTVISKTPLDREGVKELFLSVLRVHNYTALRSGEVIRVEPKTTAKGSNIIFDPRHLQDGEILTTRVIAVEKAPATDLVKVLRPMMSKEAHIAAINSVNALVISDHANNLERLEQVVRRIEVAEAEVLRVYNLEYAWVEDVVEVVEKLMLEKDKKSRVAFKVVADKRNNRVVFKGSDEEWNSLSELLAKLDKPSATSTSASVIYLRHGAAKDIADILNNLIDNKNDEKAKETQSEIRIAADESVNAIVVRAEPSVVEEIRHIVSKLDIRRAQVLIEAAIVEVTTGTGDTFGVQLAAADFSYEASADGTLRQTGNSPVLGTNFNVPGSLSLNSVAAALNGDAALEVGSGLTIGGGKVDENGKLKFGFLIQALSSNANSNLLSTPSILTLDNEEAEIVVGQEVPFRTGSTSTGSDGTSNPFTTIEREDVGVTLKVKPHISDGDVIRLEVEQTAETIDEGVTIGSNASADIVTNKRSLKTTILADDQEIIILGGLIEDAEDYSKQKVPLLGDIPLVGALFRTTSTSHVKRNLMIFLRPSIIRKKAQAAQLSQSKFDTLWPLIRPRSEGDEGYGESTSIDILFEGR